MRVNRCRSSLPSCPLSALSPCLRHVRAPHRTTIRLEKAYWVEIERLADAAGVTWQDWIERALAKKPDGANSASWLRVICLRHTTRRANHG
jgi:predicted DNA-binding ribbon-helix-helix protein